jgi:hypothetical protein
LKNGLVITDYYDLLNLHKALLEAKFHKNPDNEYVSGSPFIAKIYNDLISTLIEYDLERKGQEDWTEWRKINNHYDYVELIIGKIIKSGRWEKSNDSEKKSIIYNYLSPFSCTNEELIRIYEIINEINNTEKSFIESDSKIYRKEYVYENGSRGKTLDSGSENNV